MAPGSAAMGIAGLHVGDPIALAGIVQPLDEPLDDPSALHDLAQEHGPRSPVSRSGRDSMPRDWLNEDRNRDRVSPMAHGGGLL
ncbi:MAG: hypothetical protein O7G83_02470 [Proteobacteria bacterium]|nr:hypothetical protein [Pseudomonadota bacterium]